MQGEEYVKNYVVALGADDGVKPLVFKGFYLGCVRYLDHLQAGNKARVDSSKKSNPSSR